MSEETENTENTTTPVEEAKKPAEDTKKPDVGFSDKELEELNSQLEAAQKTIVSEEVRKIIESEKQAAKAEAEKEFMTNQKIKDLEAEKLAIEAKRLAEQKAAAEQLALLKKKVDELSASRATTAQDDPFKKPAPVAEEGFDVTKAPPELIDEIERNSLEAFLAYKQKT